MLSRFFTHPHTASKTQVPCGRTGHAFRSRIPRRSCLSQPTWAGRLLSCSITENHVSGVTSGTIRPELKTIAVVSREDGGSLKLDAGDLDVTAGWGHAGKGGVTMPGKGKVVKRDYTAEERAAVGAHGRAPLQSLERNDM